MSVIQDKEFMQIFWDLAVDEPAARVVAATKLGNKDMSEEHKKYSLKRLVKGLSSPRDSARLGFAAALTGFLHVHRPNAREVLEMIEDHTRVTGAQKGSEERDHMFGRLFGIAALARSGLVSNEDSICTDVVTRLLQLYRKKTWMQELVVDVSVHLLDSVNETIRCSIAAKLVELCSAPLEQLSENELMLRIALQQFADSSAALKSAIVFTGPSVSLANLVELKGALVKSANKFPKVHRVWDYVLSMLFSWGSQRELTPASALSDAQVEQLRVVVDIINEDMMLLSKEKRALAMTLTLKLLYLVPSEHIPLVLSERFLRSTYLARINPKATLYEFAGTILMELQQFASKQPDRILAVLSLVVEHGYIHVDKSTGVKVLQPLIGELTAESAQQVIQLLCSNIGEDVDTVESTELAGDASAAAGEEAGLRRNRAVAAVSLLGDLGRHLSATAWSEVCDALLVVLTRVACFSRGQLQLPSATAAAADKKKDKKKAAKPAAVSAEEAEVAPLLRTVSLLGVGAQGVSAELQETAALSLLGMLQDMKTRLGSLARQTQEGEEGGRQQSVQLEVRLLRRWLRVFQHLVRHGVTLRAVETDRVSAEAVSEQLLPALDRVLSVLQQGTDDHRQLNMLVALLYAVVVASVQALSSEELDVDVVSKLAEAALDVYAAAVNPSESESKKNNNDEDDDSDDDDEDDPQMRLLDATVECLAVSADQAVRSLREALRRLWGSVLGLVREEQWSQGCMDVLLDVVMANARDSEHDDHEDEGDAEEMDVDEDDEEDDEEEEEEQEKVSKQAQQKSKKQQKKEQQKLKKQQQQQKQQVDDDEEEEEEEEEVVIGEEDFMDFMMVDDEAFHDHIMKTQKHKSSNNKDDETSDNEDDGDSEDEAEAGVLVHTAEADEALEQFLKLKQESRKAGMLVLHRKQVLLRLRCLDILETLLGRLKSPLVLFSLLQGLLLGAKKALNSKLLRDLPEGRTLLQRILALLQDVCKKKLVVRLHAQSSVPSEQERLSQEFLEELDELQTLVRPLLRNKLLPLRQVAQEFVVLLTRVALASDVTAAQEKAVTFVHSLLATYLANRRSLLPGKFLEDLLVQRFPSQLLPEALPQLATALRQGALAAFTQAEVSELLHALYKRFAQLDASAQESVRRHSAQVLQALVEALVGRGQDVPAKRVKPLLQCMKAVLDTSAKAPAAAAGLGPLAMVTTAELTAVRDTVQKLSNIGSEAANDNSNSNNKQRSSVDKGVEEVLRQLAAAIAKHSHEVHATAVEEHKKHHSHDAAKDKSSKQQKSSSSTEEGSKGKKQKQTKAAEPMEVVTPSEGGAKKRKAEAVEVSVEETEKVSEEKVKQSKKQKKERK